MHSINNLYLTILSIFAVLIVLVDTEDIVPPYFIILMILPTILSIIIQKIVISNSNRQINIHKDPLITQLTKANNNLGAINLNNLKELQQKLKTIKIFDDTLKANGISKEKFKDILEFVDAKDGLVEKFANITGLEIKGDSIIFPLEFGLNISYIKLSSNGDTKDNISDKTMIISNDKERQNKIAKKATDKTNLLVAPTYQQLSQILFSSDIYGELSKIFRENLSLKDISPYQISSNIKKESMFFGRVEIISNIINRELSNYIIVGARQLGKSSLLSALHRRYIDRDMHSYYITLSNEKSDLIYHLSKVLDTNKDIQSIQEAIYSSPKPIIFLIDEIDEFLVATDNSKKFTSIFRSLAQENKAYFILAGFWALYSETLKSESPLRNFGDIIRLQGLEVEACREMIIKPMKILGISYENPQIIEDIIEITGQKSNLISVICNRLILQIDGKVIRSSDLQEVLDGGFTEYIGRSKDRLDRVVELSMINQTSFIQDDIYDVLESYGVEVDTRDLERSLQRLELSFIIYKIKGEYIYRIPLFVTKLKEDIGSFERKLKKEVGELKDELKKI